MPAEKMYSFQAVRTTYAIKVPVKGFKKVTEDWRKDEALVKEISSYAGVYFKEMNGHFGSYIYLDIDAKDDSPELHVRLADVIKTHLG